VNQRSFALCLGLALSSASPAAFSQAQGSEPVLVDIVQQLGRLENENRQLRGQIEQLQHEVQGIKKSLREAPGMAPAAAAVAVVPAPAPAAGGVPAAAAMPASPQPGASSGIAAAPSPGPAATAPTSAPATAAAPVGAAAVSTEPVRADAAPGDPAQEQARYQAAFNLLKESRYPAAADAFRQFLAAYPRSEQAPNAQYWLAEARYVMRDLKAAIAEFRKLAESWPDSRRTPDALLKIGYIHQDMDEIPAAKAAFHDLIKRFPDNPSARLAENRLQRLKLEGR
jgi:tol-pal system protein YbgF